MVAENPHANFVADIMREETDSEIAIWQHAGVRNFFHEGVLDSSDVKDLAPFLDYVIVANVTEKAMIEKNIARAFKVEYNLDQLIFFILFK